MDKPILEIGIDRISSDVAKLEDHLAANLKTFSKNLLT
jgi:hypothetical protein